MELTEKETSRVMSLNPHKVKIRGYNNGHEFTTRGDVIAKQSGGTTYVWFRKLGSNSITTYTTRNRVEVVNIPRPKSLNGQYNWDRRYDPEGWKKRDKEGYWEGVSIGSKVGRFLERIAGMSA